MAQLKLIITTDYEIFGNGSGSVDTCMIRPSETLMSIAEKHGASICFFIDVCEYWSFEKAYKEGKLKENEAEKIAGQMQDAIKRGHDVQLHFHPQWLDANYENGTWQLNEKYWRLPKVSEHPTWTIDELFKQGKRTLEEMLQPIDLSYKCDVFRAGAWCIQPEQEVLAAMKNHGFRIDSTVAPGMSYSDGRTIYDFSKAAQKASWRIDDSIIQQSEQGSLTEVPIFTVKIPASKNIKFNRIKLSRKIPMKPEGCARRSDVQYKKSKLQKALELLRPQVKMLNHSDGCSFEEMKYITSQAIKRYENSTEELPLVMIGHPKTFGNVNEFDRYLEWISSQNSIKFGKY